MNDSMMQTVPIRNVQDLLDLGHILAMSNFFKNTINEQQAAAKILAGMELGISPVAALRGLYIVEGQITLAYPMIGALIKKSGKYDYRIREKTAEACVVEFFEFGESVGFESLTMKQAKERGLDQYGAGKAKEPWRKFPENMLLSKCMSNGAKAYCSEVFFGSVYTPDELGAEVDGATGAIVEVEAEYFAEDPPESDLQLLKIIPCQSEHCESGGTVQGRGRVSALEVAEGTRLNYGKALCWDCAKLAKAAMEAAQKVTEGPQKAASVATGAQGKEAAKNALA